MFEAAGRTVSHARFGEGSVQGIDGNIISIYFRDYGARRFHYPEAFADFLKTDDGELMAMAEADLRALADARKASSDALESEMREARAPKKPAPKPRTASTRKKKEK